MSNDDNQMREAIHAAIAAALGDAYDCTRVWSAWSYGTMGEDDFSLITDDSDRMAELTDAVLSAIAAPVAAVPVDAMDTGDLIKDPLYLALDALYQRGWDDLHQGRKYDPRGTKEWQSVLDLFRSGRTLASTLAAPGIDLRERIAVILRSEFDMETADPEDPRYDDGHAEALRIADKIVSKVIDASLKGGSDAEVMQLRYQLNSLRQLLSGFTVAVQNNPLQPPCTYLEEVRLSHEFQPGEGQKVATALRNALNSEGAKS